MRTLHTIQIEPIITRALEEDWGYGDWTTDLCVHKNAQAQAKIISKQATPITVAGIEIVDAVFHKVDPQIRCQFLKDNGEEVSKGETIVDISGPAQSLLKGERVALNFLCRMMGIATLTRSFVRAVEGTGAQILDTRKTTPGLRILEKAATIAGGARNHRFGLCDGVIVKENHIRAAGGIKQAVSRLLESLSPTLKIEVEVTNLQEVQEAVEAGADLIMLDNMSPSEMTMAVRNVGGRVKVEASGNVRLDNVRQVAETGVDFISTSSILHSAPWCDLSLLFQK